MIRTSAAYPTYDPIINQLARKWDEFAAHAGEAITASVDGPSSNANKEVRDV